MTPGEEWRPIPEHPDYDVSSLGRVRSRRRKTIPLVLRPGLNPKGYLMVSLQGSDGQTTRLIHRLVAEAFLGRRPEGLVTRHLNGNQTDNRPSNLAYGTRGDNELDKVQHGTHPQAARSHCPSGHPYDDENTRVYQGRRYCRACQARWNDLRRERRKIAA